MLLLRLLLPLTLIPVVTAAAATTSNSLLLFRPFRTLAVTAALSSLGLLLLLDLPLRGVRVIVAATASSKVLALIFVKAFTGTAAAGLFLLLLTARLGEEVGVT
jgi:hypothetical protein